MLGIGACILKEAIRIPEIHATLPLGFLPDATARNFTADFTFIIYNKATGD